MGRLPLTGAYSVQEYLYCSKWKPIERTDDLDEGFSKWVVLARLYALAERLQASRFQSTVLNELNTFFQGAPYQERSVLPSQALCNLLEIACQEIPEKAVEDPLRAQIFWYAAQRLSTLQKDPCFRTLLDSQEDLGKNLCLWAGDSQRSRPTPPSNEVQHKFKPESVYL